MDAPVISDISETDDVTTSSRSEERRRERAARSSRRFGFDPATSPVLVAALAWNTAGPRR